MTRPPPHPIVSGPATRWLWVAAGWLALGLAGLGIFLPVLPTTPLVLVAAWCFSRGSERLHRRLLEDRRFGPLVRDWERHHVIPLRAKILSTAIIVPLVTTMLLVAAAPRWAEILTLVLVVWGLGFVWTKPSRPPA